MKNEKWNEYMRERSKKLSVIIFSIKKEDEERIKKTLEEHNVKLSELIKAAVMYYNEK